MIGWLLVLALVGCSKQEPVDTDLPAAGTPAGTPAGTVPTGTTPTYTEDCGELVSSTWPVQDEQQAYYRTAIQFFLTGTPTGTEELVVVPEGGSPIGGTTLVEADHVAFEPTQPLLPETTYQVWLASCPPSVVSWRTSRVGEPVDESALVGSTFAVDMGSGRWIEPAGAGALLAANLTVDVMFSVTEASATSLTVLAGMSEEGGSAQDPCSETVGFPPSDFSENPYFEVGPQDISMTILGATIDMTDVQITGAFRPDLAAIEGGTLTGSLDTRGLVDLLVPGGDETAVCTLLVTFGVPCTACPSGAGDFCVQAVVEELSVPAAPGPLVPRSEADILADPTCY